MPHRVLFFGSADFSISLLNALVNDVRFKVIGLVTQPDKPTGRCGTPSAPPTKARAQQLGLPVFQFASVKDPSAIEQIKALAADAFVVACFGQILPSTLLDAAPCGAINFHWSLLPKYRGTSPVQAAIINGDKTTGATIILMDTKMDHGPILARFEIAIQEQETGLALYHRLSNLGAPVLVDTVHEYLVGHLQPTPQDHSQATFTKLLHREDGLLDPLIKTAVHLERCIRALYPWPGAYLIINGQRLKIIQARTGPATNLSSGTRFTHNHQPHLACAQGTSLTLLEMQPEGKKIMSGENFLRGRPDWSQTAPSQLQP